MKYILSISFAIVALLAINTFSQYTPPDTKAGAKTTKSAADGSWCNSGTWNNGIPNEVKDSIVIQNGDSVNATCITNLVIGASATLIVKGCSKLVVQNIEFANGSHILVEPCAQLIVLGNLVNRNNSVNVVINGTLTVDGYVSNGNGAAISGSGTITADSIVGYCCVMGLDPDTIPKPAYVVDSTIGGILPVELLFFKLTQNGNTVLAEWAVASETNNDYFTLLKSADMMNWEEVAQISGAGNSNVVEWYEYEDELVKDEIYYMLKQTDFDGKTELLSIKSVHVNGSEYPSEIKIYPNPAKRGQYILVCCAVMEDAEVTSLDGRKPVFDRWDNAFVFYSKGVYLVRVNNRATVKVAVD